MISGKVAKERLKLVISQDRIECSPDLVEMIKSDIIDVISKYIDIEHENVTVNIIKPRCNANTSDDPVIQTSIPIKNIRVDKEE